MAMLRPQARTLARFAATVALVLGATSCEAIFADDDVNPLRVRVEAEFVTAQFFEVGDTIDGTVMPKAGVRVVVPVKYTNTGADTIWLSGCGAFGLIDTEGLSPAFASCAAILMGPRPVPPLATRTETEALNACEGTPTDHWNATYPCFVIWHDEDVAGRYRIRVQSHREVPAHYWGYVSTSNAFTLIDPRPHLDH